MTGKLLTACFFALVLIASGAPARGDGKGEVFEFERANGVYSNPNPRLEPVQQGPMVVQLRSPANEVELRENRLLLRPAGDGTHRAWLTVELQGEGDLEADLLVGGMTSTLTDRVTLPPQTVLLEGRITLEPVDGGFMVTGVEMQPELRLEIRSQLVKGLAATCSRFALLVSLGGSCRELERSLSSATVPLPKAGTAFLLSDDLLTDTDRRQLREYLQRTAGP